MSPQNHESCTFSCFKKPFPALLEVTESVRRLAGEGTTRTVDVAADLGISKEAVTARLKRAHNAGLIHKVSHKHGWSIKEPSKCKPTVRHSPALLEVAECVGRLAGNGSPTLSDVADDLSISEKAARQRLGRAVKAGLIEKGPGKHGWRKPNAPDGKPGKRKRSKGQTSKR